MNIRDLLEAEMNKLRRLNPEVHALLERIFQYKDGKGDYSVDRHEWMETLDEERFLCDDQSRSCLGSGAGFPNCVGTRGTDR